MHEVVREETLGILQASLQRLTVVRRTLETGESIAALRALARVKELNVRAISALLSACLRDALNVAEKADVDQRERCLYKLSSLAGFTLTAMCFHCRQRVGTKLKRGLMKKKPNAFACCDFNDFVKAMADETRQRILSLLQVGELNESDIVARMNLTQPTISHHLALLRRVNLVQTRREGKHVFYRANPACVTECCGEILNRYNIRRQEA
jgi:ArsR family transcriptional regulator